MGSFTKYTQIIPATDWFFVHKSEQQRPFVTRLAMRGIDTDGWVTGLMAVSSPLNGPSARTNARLMAPPPITGEYKHKDDLTRAERDALSDL